MSSDRMDRQHLAVKVAWEGGVFAALRYGIRSEDIADPEIAALWAEMERIYQSITPIAVQIGALLAAGSPLAATHDLRTGKPFGMAEMRDALARLEHADGDACTGLRCANPDHGWLQAEAERARLAPIDAGLLGMALDIVGEEDARVGVVGRGRKVDRVVAEYARLLPTQASDSPEKP